VSRACDTNGKGEESDRVLVGKPKGKRPLERPRHRWDHNGSLGIVWKGVEWIQLAQDTDWWWALVNIVMNLRVLAPRS
jgi:hypothetical protein